MTEDSMHRTLNAALARTSGPSAEDVEARVEASSLGTPEAKALRATVSDEHAARIVARAAELEDVEVLRALLAALRYSSHTFTTHEMAERILASDWLAAHTAAAEARGAERGARAVVEALRSGMPAPAFDGRYRDGYASGIFTAERAVRAATEQTGESDA